MGKKSMRLATVLSWMLKIVQLSITFSILNYRAEERKAERKRNFAMNAFSSSTIPVDSVDTMAVETTNVETTYHY